jgi:nucleotide-binding universal stress UspA family protein
MQKILVPVDFSAHSRAAASRACELARVSSTSVLLIHAVDHAAGPTNGRFASSDPIGESRLEVQRKLDELLAELAPRGIPIDAILEDRNPAEMIAEYAARAGVELIVMGSHGYRGFERTFLGSVAERTIRSTQVPVMTVKENERKAASKIRRIVLATDLSAASEPVIRIAIRWAKNLGADVEVVHAIDEGQRAPSLDDLTDGPDWLGGQRHDALASLQEILSRMSEAGISAGAGLTHGSAALEIVKRSRESRSDLVIMGRKRTLRREPVLLGHVAAGVLKQARCSVLLVPEIETDHNAG